MNIKEAKEEIKHTLLAYNRKDAAGRYTFPKLRQRPILLMGPPGIGKTAIMEQVAEECGISIQEINNEAAAMKYCHQLFIQKLTQNGND